MFPVTQCLALFLTVVCVSNGALKAGLMCDVCNAAIDPSCASPVKTACYQDRLSGISVLLKNYRLGCLTVIGHGKDGSQAISKKCVVDLSPAIHPCEIVQRVANNSGSVLKSIDCTVCYTDNCNSNDASVNLNYNLLDE